MLPNDTDEVLDEQPLSFAEKMAQAREAAAARRKQKSSEPLLTNDDVVGTLAKIHSNANSPSQAKNTGWSPEDISTLKAGLSLFLLVGTRMLSERVMGDASAAMLEDEIDALTSPMARLLLRHLKIDKSKRGDFTDGAAIVMVLGAYLMRVYGLAEEKWRKQRWQAKHPESANHVEKEGTIVERIQETANDQWTNVAH